MFEDLVFEVSCDPKLARLLLDCMSGGAEWLHLYKRVFVWTGFSSQTVQQSNGGVHVSLGATRFVLGVYVPFVLCFCRLLK